MAVCKRPISNRVSDFGFVGSYFLDGLLSVITAIIFHAGNVMMSGTKSNNSEPCA